jgi:hypothetical protein
MKKPRIENLVQLPLRYFPYGFVFTEKIESFEKFGLRSVNDTTGSDPEVSMRPRDPTLVSQWDHRILYDTTGSFEKTIIGSHSL